MLELNGIEKEEFLYTRSDVDYGVASAHTTYGICGIKVWIYLGDIMENNPFAKDNKSEDKTLEQGKGL